MDLTQERLKELLIYDPETGIFCWRIDRGGRPIGSIAGCASHAYIRISVDYKSYRAHHLAWLYMTGAMPIRFVDHRDTNKQNNIWTNLRSATKSQNQANIGLIKSNKSGLKGVSRYKAGDRRGKPWQASISCDGHNRSLGHFSTKEEAHAAYIKAAEHLFGEFARAA